MNDHDQRNLWIAAYGKSPTLGGRVSQFVPQCLPWLVAQSRVLELGCGAGADAEALARAGHTVTATDFVPAVIASNRERLRHLSNLTFDEIRIDEPYPYADSTFDAVYAHLTIHYFRHDITKSILSEVRRVLTRDGRLMFACKSPADPSYGKGTEIEADMFDFHGKIRHFFSETYTRELLADRFTDVTIRSHQGKLYRQRAGWITVIATAC